MEPETSKDEILKTDESKIDESKIDESKIDESKTDESKTDLNHPTSWQAFKHSFSYLFELDPRSLALFRIVFGTLCVADLWLRLPHLQMMYASSGWMPSHRVLWYASTDGQESAHGLSLLYLFNTTPMITAFFFVAIFCAVCFTLGYRTRLFHILTGICMLSVHTRNDVLHNGGDTVHNLWWMWTIWLPPGGRWSIDALRKSWKTPDPDDTALNQPRQRDTRLIYSLVACAVLVNLSACYYLNGVHKNSSDWMNGDAVPYVLEQDRILTTFGHFAREYFPLWMLRFLSWSTLIAEASFPLFLLLPMVSRRANMMCLLAGAVVTHFMFGTTPLTTILLLLAFTGVCGLLNRIDPLSKTVPHFLFVTGIALSVYLLAFPLWLAVLVALFYALPAAILFHFDIQLRQTWTRRLALLALGGFHVGAGASLQLGFFSYWMVSIYCVLLRSEDWELIKRLFKPRAKPITLFYDSDCGVCHALARLGARLDLYQKITWVGRNHTIPHPRGLNEAEFQQLREVTIIAVFPRHDDHNNQSERIWTHHRAVAQVLRRIPLLTPLSWIVSLLGPIGHLMYQGFANRRHRVSAWLGYGVCGLPLQKLREIESANINQIINNDAQIELSGLEQTKKRIGVGFRELGATFCIVASISILFSGNTHYNKRHDLQLPKKITIPLKVVESKYVITPKADFKLLSNLFDGNLKASFPSFYRNPVKPPYFEWARSFAKYGGFYQGWGLFTHIPKTDGWMIFEVKLSDGRVLDMRTGLPPNYEVADYKRRTWGFYEARWGLKLLQRANLRPLVTEWATRQIPRMRLKASDRVDELNLYWVSDDTQKPIQSETRPPKFKEKKLIHSWSRKTEQLKNFKTKRNKKR